MHSLWTGVLPRQVFADAPPSGFDVEPDPTYTAHLAELIEQHAHEVAAVIVEPVVQNAGGYLRVLRELCDAHGILLVFDEIATGFGRTGTLFAADYANVAPDVMCVGKALTGGYLSLAATICTPKVAHGIGRGDFPVLAHGPTFMGNPLAAAVAGASLDLLAQGAWEGQVKRIETGLRSGLAHARTLSGVSDVRVLGAIGVVQLDHKVDRVAATRAAAQHGVWIRPFRDLVYTMPPYVVDDADLGRITTAMLAAAAAG